MTRALDSAHIPRLLMIGVVLLSVATWFLRESDPNLSYLVWALSAAAGIFALAAAWRQRDGWLALCGVLVFFTDFIVLGALFAFGLALGSLGFNAGI